MTLKTKLNNFETTHGTWLTIPSTQVAEVLCLSNLDWITIDMEHSAIDFSNTLNLIAVIESKGIAPLIRIGDNNPYLIKRVMDMGAHGVIVPMVNSKEDAEKAVQAVKYAPIGNRGVGLARAQAYGKKFEEYKKWNQESSVIIAQIEHIDAVSNFKEIVQTEHIDGFIIGPYDLSASMGIPGQFDHPDFIKAMKDLDQMTKEVKTNCGIHIVYPDPSLYKQKIEAGYNFIGYGTDFIFLNSSCDKALNDIQA